MPTTKRCTYCLEPLEEGAYHARSHVVRYVTHRPSHPHLLSNWGIAPAGVVGFDLCFAIGCRASTPGDIYDACP